MKQVNLIPQYVLYTNLSDKDFIGVEYSDGQRCQVVKLDNKNWITVSIGVNNNYISKIKNYSLKDLTKDIIELSNGKVFVFNTRTEFIEFLLN